MLEYINKKLFHKWLQHPLLGTKITQPLNDSTLPKKERRTSQAQQLKKSATRARRSCRYNPITATNQPLSTLWQGKH